MKIIIISDRLTETIEIDSDDPTGSWQNSLDSAFMFGHYVKDTVEGVLRTEQLDRNGRRA